MADDAAAVVVAAAAADGVKAVVMKALNDCYCYCGARRLRKPGDIGKDWPSVCGVCDGCGDVVAAAAAGY